MASAAFQQVEARRGLQTFAADDDRRRLTGAAVKAVLRLVDAWDGSNAEGAAFTLHYPKIDTCRRP